MNDLPEDLNLWPADPYELLGIEHHTDERSVRRAYLRLVRRFKPDFYPEHFQRVREAHDMVLQYLEYQRFTDDHTEFDPREYETGISRPIEPMPTARTPAAHDIAWQVALEGREQEAYSLLVRFYQQREAPQEACLRLYWLLKSQPELDAKVTPCHWLVAGLKETRLCGPLRDLYDRELATNPGEAVTAHATELVTLEAEPGPLYDFLEVRWRACGKLGRWSDITRDLQSIKPLLAYQHEATWVRLLLLAAGHLAWCDQEALQDFLHLRQAISQAVHLHHELSAELDRFDLLLEIRTRFASLRSAKQVPQIFTELVQRSWVESYAEYQELLDSVVLWLAANPTRGLNDLDQLEKHNHAAAMHLVQVIRFYPGLHQDYDGRALKRVSTTAARFFHSLQNANYRLVRSQILEFCLNEVLDPVWLAQAGDELLGKAHRGSTWSESITNDLGLCGVYHACRAVRG